MDKIPLAKSNVNRKRRADRIPGPGISGRKSCFPARGLGYCFPFLKAVKSVINPGSSMPSARLSFPVLAAMAVFAAAPAMAQSASAQSTPKLSFSWLTPPGHPAASKSRSGGDSLTLNVHIELAEGWHINSEAPLDSFLVPTSLELKSEPPEAIAFGKPRYPQPMIQHNKVMGDLSLFTGAFDVQVPAKVSGKGVTRPGRTRVTLNYQSCNNTMCLPPKSITVEQ
jgi:DsbC/DsbD-like thiol-disulfide interchange protein